MQYMLQILVPLLFYNSSLLKTVWIISTCQSLKF